MRRCVVPDDDTGPTALAQERTRWRSATLLLSPRVRMAPSCESSMTWDREDDPTGIPRSDFEQDGFHYTLTDLLRQELPEHDERQHTETVSLQSANKDMASILALLPQEKEFITEDGYMGTLSLQLDTVQVEVSGYGSSTREISATRSYPNLANQDTSNIPKTIQDNGRTLTLQTINWQTDNTATLDATPWVTALLPWPPTPAVLPAAM